MENQIILYQTEQGNVTVNVVFQNESFWLTQKAMSELFGVESHTITYHLKEIFQSGELQLEATTRKIRAVQQERNRNVSRELDFYNLDAIIAVGYRVNSRQATRFRIWATNTLNAGKISHEQAIGKAEQEYEVFRIEQDKRYISNFDEVMKRLENK